MSHSVVGNEGCHFAYSRTKQLPSVGVVGLMGQERRMRREMEEFNDLVFLPVTEGYRMNSRKVGWAEIWVGWVGLVGL